MSAAASPRTRRIADDQGVAATAAGEDCEESDRERERYFERLYELDRELPTHYDLVVNTAVLTAEQAASLIIHAAVL